MILITSNSRKGKVKQPQNKSEVARHRGWGEDIGFKHKQGNLGK